MRTLATFTLLATMSTVLTAPQAIADDSENQSVYATFFRIHVAGKAELASKYAKTTDFQRQLDRLQKNDQILLTETLRLRFLSGMTASVQIGRQVPIVVGVTSRGGLGRTSNVRISQVGSLVKLQSRLEGESIYAELNYESSYLQPEVEDEDDEDGDDDEKDEDDDLGLQPPTIATLSVTSTLKAELGEVNLVQHRKEDAVGLYLFALFDTGSPVPSAPASRPRSRAEAPPASPARRAAASRTSRSTDRTPAGSNVTDSYRRYAAAYLGRFDTNKNGKIDKEEAKGQRIERYMTADGKWDKNGDGQMDAEELTAVLRTGSRRSSSPTSRDEDDNKETSASNGNRYLAYTRQLLKRLDDDNDGAMSRSELRNFTYLRGDEAFAEADADNNGKISAEELAKTLQTLARRRAQPKDPERADDKSETKEADDKPTDEAGS